MKYLIEGKEVVQYLQIPESSIPKNLKVAEGENSTSISQVYYDSSLDEVRLKPARPGQDYEWSIDSLSWVKREEGLQEETAPNFTDLFESFRGTEIWNKIKAAGTKSLRLNLAVTMLIAALTATKSTIGLEDALSELRAALVDSSQTSDFAADELEEINVLLVQHGFNFQLI